MTSSQKSHPRIEVAAGAGFCFGVKRAVTMASKAPQEYPGLSIRTLGPIIHNPQVVERLAGLGIHEAGDTDKLVSGVVIIRSHGITRQLTQTLRLRPELTIIDATCPFVRRAQEIVAEMSRSGYLVFIVGEPNHPEVAGLISYGEPKTTFVVSRAAEIPEALINRQQFLKIAVLAQTTQTQEVFAKVVRHLISFKGEVRCFNTICNATSDRQQEALKLARRSDCMIIIGGRSSANTNRLQQICKQVQPASHHIETAAELQKEWFTKKITIGITAGASTPKWLIDEVVEAIKTISNNPII